MKLMQIISIHNTNKITRKEIKKLRNYIGTYRVQQTTDTDYNFTDNDDDTYVKCKNNIRLFRYSDEVLGLYIPSPIIANRLRKDLWEYLTTETQEQILYEINNSSNHRLSGEWMFYFYENYIDKVAEIIEPKTTGANINPKSKKNLPKTKRNKYVPKDEEFMEFFKAKLKDIVTKNNSNISLYVKAYQFIESKSGKDITAYSKKNNIKLAEAMDALEITDVAIEILDEFEKLL